MSLLDDYAIVAHISVGGRVLQENPAQLVVVKIDRVGASHMQRDPQRFRSCPHDRNRLGMAILRNKKRLPVLAGAAGNCQTHGHGFGCCGGLVQERGVRQGETGQIRDHGLKIDQGF